MSKIVQLLVFTDCTDLTLVLRPLDRLELDCVLYKDLNDPQGIGLLVVADHPDDLVYDLRDLLSSRAYRVLMQRHELTMIGRSFPPSNRNFGEPSSVIGNVDWPWAIWHALRGTTGLSALSDPDQREALASLVETGEAANDDIGHICLKSHGLDRAGNEFVHGLHGRNLGEISAHIEGMKRAEKHASNIASSGPFFTGRTVRSGEAVDGQRARW